MERNTLATSGGEPLLIALPGKENLCHASAADRCIAYGPATRRPSSAAGSTPAHLSRREQREACEHEEGEEADERHIGGVLGVRVCALGSSFRRFALSGGAYGRDGEGPHIRRSPAKLTGHRHKRRLAKRLPSRIACVGTSLMSSEMHATTLRLAWK